MLGCESGNMTTKIEKIFPFALQRMFRFLKNNSLQLHDPLVIALDKIVD